jgi:adenylate kinase family enzyme
MRIAIIGNSGSGKTSLARQFASNHGLVTLDLDTVAWEPGKVAVPRRQEHALSDVAAFCEANERWIVEGCYAGLVAAALSYSPLLLFVEPGVEACLANCRSRPWEPHKYKSKEEQDENLEFLLSWVREYYSRDGDLSLKAHQALFGGFPGAKRKLTERVTQELLDELAPPGR